MTVNVHVRTTNDGRAIVEIEEWGWTADVPAGASIEQTARALLVKHWPMSAATARHVPLNEIRHPMTVDEAAPETRGGMRLQFAHVLATVAL